jgi:TonB family protein
MKKLILILVLNAPLISIAGNGNPINYNFTEWINNNINYPTQAIENHEEGVVYVSFSISEKGEAENIVVEEGVSIALNNEAIVAVSKMPLESMYDENEPAKSFILPIKFTLK